MDSTHSADYYTNTQTSGTTGRFGNATRGKRKGVKYIIKVL